MFTDHSAVFLFIEPHVSHCLFVKRPTTRVDHERGQQKINGSTNQFVHVLLGAVVILLASLMRFELALKTL